MLVIFYKRLTTKQIDLGIPVISIGNIIVGGSGKTPLAIYLASKYENSCVVLRGYGRQSKGLFVISQNGKILEDVKVAGDEAMLLAKSLPNASIIVSEDRILGIKKAKQLGAKVVFLDDGFSKYHIKKFNILLSPKKTPTNNFCLPSGCYREPKTFYNKADLLLQEGRDFERITTIKKDAQVSSLPFKTVLITAISKPKRLLDFLPSGTKMVSFADHHNFTLDDIEKIKEEYKDYAFITTGKDLVKLENLGVKDLYLMDLDLRLAQNISLEKMQRYIKEYE